MRVYDPSSEAWSAAAPLPAPRGGHAAVVLDGKIHVLGGGNSMSTIADHSVYDPATDSWTEAAPLPRAEGSPAAVVFGGRLYAIGGRSGFSDFGDVYVYDAADDAWTTRPVDPAARALPAPSSIAARSTFSAASRRLGQDARATCCA